MRTRPALATLALVITLAAAGCANGSGTANHSGLTASTMTSNTPPATSPGATAPADVAAATAAVKQVYAEFFSAPVHKAMTLLQDGPTLGKAFKIAAKTKGGASESAEVKSVTFAGPTTANVTYDLATNGSVVLHGANGQAVLIGGQWKVAKATFCTLVGLAQPGKPVPGC